jgi:hypothetical protein
MLQADNPVNHYICNPDVVLREEDEDGGLLFNPDNNQVKVVNATGLFIWRQCAKGVSAETITAALADAFNEVPSETVAADVEEFLTAMIHYSFIGLASQG